MLEFSFWIENKVHEKKRDPKQICLWVSVCVNKLLKVKETKRIVFEKEKQKLK